MSSSEVPQLPQPSHTACSMCRGAKKLPVNGGGFQWCPFCGGTGENMWYERNVAASRRSYDNRRRFWVWFCWLWVPGYVLVTVLAEAGHAAQLAYTLGYLAVPSTVVVIGKAIHLYCTRVKTPWAQDATATAVITGGLFWARHNNRRGYGR